MGVEALKVLEVFGTIAVLFGVAACAGHVLSWSITRISRPPKTWGERVAEHFCWGPTSWSR